MAIGAISSNLSPSVRMNMVSHLKADEKEDFEKIGIFSKDDDEQSQIALQARKDDLADVEDALDELKPNQFVNPPSSDEEMNQRFGAAYQVDLAQA